MKSQPTNTHWQYWLIRDSGDTPIELVRAEPGTHVVIAGEGTRKTQHKRSRFFLDDNKPNLDYPVSFQLIHVGDASAPAIGTAMDDVEGALWLKQQKTAKRKRYAVEDAQVKALALMSSGSGIREAARLCGVPKSTVADWRASQLSGN